MATVLNLDPHLALGRPCQHAGEVIRNLQNPQLKKATGVRRPGKVNASSSSPSQTLAFTEDFSTQAASGMLAMPLTIGEPLRLADSLLTPTRPGQQHGGTTSSMAECFSSTGAAEFLQGPAYVKLPEDVDASLQHLVYGLGSGSFSQSTSLTTGLTGGIRSAFDHVSSSIHDMPNVPQCQKASMPEHCGIVLTSGAQMFKGEDHYSCLLSTETNEQRAIFAAEGGYSTPVKHGAGSPKHGQSITSAQWSDSVKDSGTLRQHLKELMHKNEDRILMVRKINRLGFRSPALLRQHFSQYGAVDITRVAHSRVVSHTSMRMRPGSLGFVVMKTHAGALAALAAGEAQHVDQKNGQNMSTVPIEVRRFESHFHVSLGDDDIAAKECFVPVETYVGA